MFIGLSHVSASWFSTYSISGRDWERTQAGVNSAPWQDCQNRSFVRASVKSVQRMRATFIIVSGNTRQQIVATYFMYPPWPCRPLWRFFQFLAKITSSFMLNEIFSIFLPPCELLKNFFVNKSLGSGTVRLAWLNKVRPLTYPKHNTHSHTLTIYISSPVCVYLGKFKNVANKFVNAEGCYTWEGCQTAPTTYKRNPPYPQLHTLSPLITHPARWCMTAKVQNRFQT